MGTSSVRRWVKNWKTGTRTSSIHPVADARKIPPPTETKEISMSSLERNDSWQGRKWQQRLESLCGSGGAGKIVIPERCCPLDASLSYVGAETTETKVKKYFLTIAGTVCCRRQRRLLSQQATGDKRCVHPFDPTKKRMEWHHTTSLRKN
jgi:hypothetical protein